MCSSVGATGLGTVVVGLGTVVVVSVVGLGTVVGDVCVVGEGAGLNVVAGVSLLFSGAGAGAGFTGDGAELVSVSVVVTLL